jgi:serine/threonine protein kinase
VYRCSYFDTKTDAWIPETIAAKIFAQIVLAIKYLDSIGIVHRDLKDENVVVDSDYNIKLIDFGSASLVPRDKSDYFTKYNGTALYAAPEIVRGNIYRGPEAEIWYARLTKGSWSTPLYYNIWAKPISNQTRY